MSQGPPNPSKQAQSNRAAPTNYAAGQQGMHGRPIYYIEDTEGYVGDYSESDGLSDSGQPQKAPPPRPRPPADVTELYRRRPPSAPPIAYRQGVYLPPEYYYEQPPPVRVMQVQPPPHPQMYQKRIPMATLPQSREEFYSPQEMQYQHHPQAMYHPSLQQLSTQSRPTMVQRTPSATMLRQQQRLYMQRQLQMQQQQKLQHQQQLQSNTIKRHPVTVRTPRYVRRPTTVYKRPSALCIPIACQPDPAVQYRRVRRVVQAENSYNQVPPQECVTRRHSLPTPIPINTTKPKKVEPRRSLDITKNRLDSILERYENILGKNSEENLVVSDQEMAKHLKPRIPPSLKEKPKIPKITKQQIPEIMKNAETFEVEEITSEVLDELLSELSENGLSDVINFSQQKLKQSPSRQNVHESFVPAGKCDAELSAAKNPQLEIPVKDVPKSYNYQDIKESLDKMHYNSESDDGKSQKLKNLEKSNNVTKKISKINARDALELHRTKSYVVNLIDTALSSHFGTNVCDKSSNNNSNNSNKEYLDPKSAVEMLKNQSSGKMDKDLCLEIAQVLTDSYVSSSTAPNCPKSTSECTCKSQQSVEEPAFVKQLKQMRWGHLRHIQREVRRLEDLERFLDSCSVSSFEKYNNH